MLFVQQQQRLALFFNYFIRYFIYIYVYNICIQIIQVREFYYALFFFSLPMMLLYLCVYKERRVHTCTCKITLRLISFRCCFFSILLLICLLFAALYCYGCNQFSIFLCAPAHHFSNYNLNETIIVSIQLKSSS